MNGLDWQTLQLLLAAGMNQKSDARALNPPELARCVDVQFDDLGGLQTRYPYANVGTSILGGGTLADCRRIVENGPELLCFTKDALYSWNAQVSKWVAKGTHLAVKVDERSVFATTDEQYECDRAELSSTIVYAWTGNVESTAKVYVAAVDKNTGAVLMAPTALPGSASRPRVVALTTKILLTFYDGIGGLYAYALDPASPATALAGSSTTLTNSSFGTYYDITRVLGSDSAIFVARKSPTTSYTVGKVTAALAVTTASKARNAADPVAISCSPDGLHATVVRTEGTGPWLVMADILLLSNLSDVLTDIEVGSGSSTIRQIAAAHRSVQDGGEYRCYAFWTYAESLVGNGGVRSNWIGDGGDTGTEDDFVLGAVGVASRAFDHDGHVFVNLVFAGNSYASSELAVYGQSAQLQNSYFLYRDDGELVAKQSMNKAGGFTVSASHLPGVASTGTGVYAWCGTDRRVIRFGNQSSYSDRGPRDLEITFDSNEARRCVRLGQTLYITGAEIKQYDGVRLVEVGFHYFPFYFDLTDTSGGNVEAGTYYYKISPRWTNAAGETDRGSTATAAGNTFGSSSRTGALSLIATITVTHKTDNPIALEVWRTQKNPPDDAPYYLVSSKDPSAGSGNNRYVANDVNQDQLSSGFGDALKDDTARLGEENPENGAVLEQLAPPPASIILANETRIFLAGVAGDPDRVWYSRQRGDGQVASFHDSLTTTVPGAGGDITALAFLQETLVVFRESAIYVLPGDGLDNTGNGANFGPSRIVSTDLGAVNQESVAVTDRGLIFKSSKGWYVLNRGWSLEYIGAGVADYDDETPLAVHVVESQHQVRILTSARLLVLDTLVGQWGEWTIADGVHACMWGGQHTYLTATGPKQQQTTYTGVDYGLDIETAWIKFADLQGAGRLRWFEVLGEYCSAHRLRVRLARDYWRDGVDTYFQDKSWTVSPTTVGGPLQLRHGPKIQQMQAIKIRLTAINATVDDTAPDGEALKLTGLALELGFKRGLNRQIPAAQKQ